MLIYSYFTFLIVTKVVLSVLNGYFYNFVELATAADSPEDVLARWALWQTPRLAPRRCNICPWFQKREIIKGKGHQCPEAARKAVAQEGMTV